MLMMPHLGYGMTYAPTIVLLFAVVVFSRRGVLARRIVRRPAVLLVPLLAMLALLPGVLDLIREQHLQDARSSYSPELGVLHQTLTYENIDFSSVSSWILNAAPLIHTFVFPVLALVDPGAYQWTESPGVFQMSWNAYQWPFSLVQFHGGVLLVLLAGWSIWRPKLDKRQCLERTLAVVAVMAMLVALLNTNFEPLRWLSLGWAPVGLLSNSRWQYSDLSLLLTLVLLVWRADALVGLFRQVSRGRTELLRRAARVFVVSGVFVMICVLPYRVAEPVRLNGGQTRFAPMQFDPVMRQSNEQWRLVLESLRRDRLGLQAESPQRVLIEGEGLMGAEGDNSWWGLRTHSQLRDVQLSTLLSWPRLRSGLTLTPGDKFQQIVSDPVCDETFPMRLDVLAVEWAILQTSCVKDYFPSSMRVPLPLSPDWKSFKSGRPQTQAMIQMFASASRVDYSATRLSEFHHWWTKMQPSTLQPCGLLAQSDKDPRSCVSRLGLVAGKSVVGPPLAICKTSCLAKYRLEQLPPSAMHLVVPLRFDSTIRAVQDGAPLAIVDFAGLVAIQSNQLRDGLIEFSLVPDSIMKLRSISPLIGLAVLLFAVVSRRRTVVSWRPSLDYGQ